MVKVALLCALAGCALDADLGLLQRGLADGAGGSLTAHGGVGQVPDKILALQIDTRVDVAESGSRFAAGASVLGGLPVLGGKVLARAGVWRAIASSVPERVVVPTFELAGYVPLREPGDHTATAGLMFGVRDDIDLANYVTVFVGLAVFVMPGP